MGVIHSSGSGPDVNHAVESVKTDRAKYGYIVDVKHRVVLIVLVGACLCTDIARWTRRD